MTGVDATLVAMKLDDDPAAILDASELSTTDRRTAALLFIALDIAGWQDQRRIARVALGYPLPDEAEPDE